MLAFGTGSLWPWLWLLGLQLYKADGQLSSLVLKLWFPPLTAEFCCSTMVTKNPYITYIFITFSWITTKNWVYTMSKALHYTHGQSRVWWAFCGHKFSIKPVSVFIEPPKFISITAFFCAWSFTTVWGNMRCSDTQSFPASCKTFHQWSMSLSPSSLPPCI